MELITEHDEYMTQLDAVMTAESGGYSLRHRACAEAFEACGRISKRNAESNAYGCVSWCAEAI